MIIERNICDNDTRLIVHILVSSFVSSVKLNNFLLRDRGEFILLIWMLNKIGDNEVTLCDTAFY